ncbi:MAG: hypothetical protein Hens3KO_27760 [Henriciella sp.]
MRLLILGLAVLGLGACNSALETSSLSASDIAQASTTPTAFQTEAFDALIPLIGKTFRGTPVTDDENAPADIQKWSWALGGNAILIQHAIEDGSYGGDSYVYKDAATGGLVYVYITSAGFRTEGTITVAEDGSFTAEEDVKGHPSITKVRSTSHLDIDGPGTMTSEYLDNGVWVQGHAFDYLATDEALPLIKVQTSE